ncbi:MAG: hypothetical protein K8W52_13740 [Deltaproteobacteria bacterium]|nr:hypothetical protein [Deltaproteobacteria bacterium]
MQPSTRPLLAVLALAPMIATRAAARPTPTGTDLPLVIALARQCVAGAPHGGKGPGGGALDRNPLALGRLGAGPTWGVLFDEAASPSRGSVTVVIDPVARTCDGRRVRVAKPASRIIDVDALIAAARRCAAGAPWSGRGVGGSPLSSAAPTVTYHPFDDGLVLGFAETQFDGAPSGLDLAISFDGICGAVAMD